MNTKNTIKIILFAGMVVLVAAGIFLVFSGQQASAKSKDWVGSWSVVGTADNAGFSFPALYTFFRDGNVMGDTLPDPRETVSHGNWISTGKNHGVYTLLYQVASDDPSIYQKGTVSGDVVYDPTTDTWNGPFTITVVDQDGNVLYSDTGTMDAYARILAIP